MIGAAVLCSKVAIKARVWRSGRRVRKLRITLVCMVSNLLGFAEALTLKQRLGMI